MFGNPRQLMNFVLISGYLLSLILGTAIYLSFRAETLLVFAWVRYFGCGDAVEWLRAAASPYASVMPSWILYSLPDGLWIFSYTCLMLAIWGGCPGWGNGIWFGCVPLLGLTSEILQRTGWIPGRFDWMDLLFYSLGFLIPLSLLRRRNSRPY